MLKNSLTTANLLLCSLIVASGQQTFQKKGDHYHAKVDIRREKPRPFNLQINAPNGPPGRLSYDKGYQQDGPWRQGDRITRDEVVQNLARALLSRKMTTEDIQNERRKDNKEKLHEYALYQARMAKKGPEPSYPAKPASLPYASPVAPVNTYNMMEPYPGAKLKVNIMEQKGQDFLNKGPGNQQQMLPPQKEQHPGSLVQAHITRYTKTVGQPHTAVKPRQFMKPNSFQT